MEQTAKQQLVFAVFLFARFYCFLGFIAHLLDKNKLVDAELYRWYYIRSPLFF